MAAINLPERGQDAPRSVWDIRERLDENYRRVEALLREIETADDRKLRLAAVTELRQHIALAEKTLESAARTEAVRAFEETVLEALAHADATVRQKVMDVLNARVVSDNLPHEAAEPVPG
jgi:hypothetical protein